MSLRPLHPPRADIAVLTIIQDELFAVLQALGIPESARVKDESGTIYYRWRVRSERARRDYNVVLTCVGREGNPPTAAAVQDVLHRYAPQAVLLVGIAAGLKHKVRIGEVVFSERVVAYESAAEGVAPDGSAHQEPRPEIRQVPYRMQQDVVNYRPDRERLEQRFKRTGGAFPAPPAKDKEFYREHVATRISVKRATVASGEKLLRNPGKLLEFRKLHGKTEVGEMEAAGLMQACERQGIPWLVIRGISDFGDEFKNDHFHELATRSAAAVLADFLEYGLELTPQRSRGAWALVAGALLLVAVAGGVAWQALGERVPSPLTASRVVDEAARQAGYCAGEFGDSPFKNPRATHFLVANFYGAASTAEPNFSETVSTQVTQALETYKEEVLRNPTEIDIAVPEGSLEIERLPCFLKNHEEAEAAARALNADVVIWGQAFCNVAPSVTVNQQNTTIVGDISAQNSDIRIGTTEVHTAKPYTVCPKATLFRPERSFRRSSEHGLDLASLGHMDLPTLRSTEPFLLIHFALGLHFYELNNYWLAARFFEKSAEALLPKERGAAEIGLALGTAYYHLPNLERSLRYSRQALESVRGSGTRLEAELINNIGKTLEALGDYPGALEHFQQGLALGEKVLGKEHPLMATFLCDIGGVHLRRQDYAKALSYCRQALALTQATLGEDHPATAPFLSSIGRALQAQGDTDEALGHYQRALALYQQAFGQEHPWVANLIGGIGTVRQAQGDTEAALESYKRALAISERTLGKAHPSVAMDLTKIGHAFFEKQDYALALAYYQQALAIDVPVLGDKHPDLAPLLSHIGAVLTQLKSYEGALLHYQEALAIREQAFGKDHPILVPGLHRIGELLETKGDSDGALKLYERALAIQEQHFGTEAPELMETHGKLTLLLAKRDDPRSAVEHFRKLVAGLEKRRGTDNLEVAESLYLLGQVLERWGSAVDALAQFRRSLTIRMKLLGSEHLDVAQSLSTVGRLLGWLGDSRGAVMHFQRALLIRERLLGKDHLDLVYDLNDLSRELVRQGDLAGALEQDSRALALYEKHYGKFHPTEVMVLTSMATILDMKGDRKEALEYYGRALALGVRILGKDHSVLQAIITNLVTMLEEPQDGPERVHTETVLRVRCEGATCKARELEKPPEGVAVLSCEEAACAGLTTGDRILEYGHRRIVHDARHLRDLMAFTPREQEVLLTVSRGGKRVKVPVHGGPLGVRVREEGCAKSISCNCCN
jgi:tetratricopeptide (TPR) repeat protein/nucleoside phosphorylase